MPPRRSSKRKSSSPYAGGRQSSARSQVVKVDLPTTTTPPTTAQAVPPQDAHTHPPQTTAVCTPALLQPGLPWNPVSAGSDLGLHDPVLNWNLGLRPSETICIGLLRLPLSKTGSSCWQSGSDCWITSSTCTRVIRNDFNSAYTLSSHHQTTGRSG